MNRSTMLAVAVAAALSGCAGGDGGSKEMSFFVTSVGKGAGAGGAGAGWAAWLCPSPG